MRGFRLCAELGEKGKPDARKAMESFSLELKESEQQDVYAASPPLLPPALEITACCLVPSSSKDAQPHRIKPKPTERVSHSSPASAKLVN